MDQDAMLPPVGAEDLTWHWVKRGADLLPARWMHSPIWPPGVWRIAPYLYTAHEAFLDGWRYVAPIPFPTEQPMA